MVGRWLGYRTLLARDSMRTAVAAVRAGGMTPPSHSHRPLIPSLTFSHITPGAHRRDARRALPARVRALPEAAALL